MTTVKIDMFGKEVKGVVLSSVDKESVQVHIPALQKSGFWKGSSVRKALASPEEKILSFGQGGEPPHLNHN